MAKRGLPRAKVLATVINLLETTLIRVGNKDYAKDNGSYGLTTLRSRHVAVASNELRFQCSWEGSCTSDGRRHAIEMGQGIKQGAKR
jgi:DNA topoisomerase IB